MFAHKKQSQMYIILKLHRDFIINPPNSSAAVPRCPDYTLFHCTRSFLNVPEDRWSFSPLLYIMLLIPNLPLSSSGSANSSIFNNEFVLMPTVDLSELLREVTRSSFTWRTASTCLSPAASDWFLQTANNGSQFSGKDLGCSPECFCIKWHSDSAVLLCIVTHSESSSAHSLFTLEYFIYHALFSVNTSALIVVLNRCSSERCRLTNNPLPECFLRVLRKEARCRLHLSPSLLRVWQDYSSLRFLLWLCL